MNLGLQLKPIEEGSALAVGSLVRLEILAEGSFGTQGESWTLEEASKAPNGIWGSGSLTLFAEKATQLAPQGGFTKIEIPAMIHGLGSLSVGPFTLRHSSGASIAIPTTDLRTTIAGPQEKMEPQWFLPLAKIGGWNYPVLILLAALPLLVLAGFLWWRRRASRLAAWAALNPADAAILALRNLERSVKRKEPRTEAEWKSFSFELTSQLKRYAGARFSFNSADLTDRELIGELKRMAGAGKSVDLLAALLKELDEVRYGQRILVLSRAPELAALGLRFVDLTPPPSTEKGQR